MIKHADGTPDHRYRVTLEWCGKPEQKYIFRFCDDWQGWYDTEAQACTAAQQHKDSRDAEISKLQA